MANLVQTHGIGEEVASTCWARGLANTVGHHDRAPTDEYSDYCYYDSDYYDSDSTLKFKFHTALLPNSVYTSRFALN